MPGAPGPTGVDDLYARMIITPIVGVAIPNLAGMIDHSAHRWSGLFAAYAWFVVVAFITWEGNLRLYLRFQDRTAWLTRPWHRVRLLVGLIGLFTVPFTASALWGWAVLFGDPAATPRAIAMAMISIVAAVTFITHVYETVFLVREWESDRLRNERLQRENVEAELAMLKSEVDPHTLFNNLNALAYLVEQGDARAGRFVTMLASCYRYLLNTRNRRLVPLTEEFALLDQFVGLLALRYAGGVKVVLEVGPADAARWQLPPVVLPELLENAAKHNEFSSANPLMATASPCRTIGARSSRRCPLLALD
jgi:sensor histidine kinase YesM